MATGFVVNYPDNQNLFEKTIEGLKIDIRKKFRQINIPVRIIRRLLSLPIIFDAIATELHEEFYKGNLENIFIGPKSNQINGEEFLKTSKYIYILASIYGNEISCCDKIKTDDLSDLSSFNESIYHEFIISKN